MENLCYRKCVYRCTVFIRTHSVGWVLILSFPNCKQKFLRRYGLWCSQWNPLCLRYHLSVFIVKLHSVASRVHWNNPLSMPRAKLGCKYQRLKHKRSWKENIFFCGAVTSREKYASWCPFCLYKYLQKVKKERGDEPFESSITAGAKWDPTSFLQVIFFQGMSSCYDSKLLWKCFAVLMHTLSAPNISVSTQSPLEKGAVSPPAPSATCPPSRGLSSGPDVGAHARGLTLCHVLSLQRRPDLGGRYSPLKGRERAQSRGQK